MRENIITSRPLFKYRSSASDLGGSSSVSSGNKRHDGTISCRYSMRSPYTETVHNVWAFENEFDIHVADPTDKIIMELVWVSVNTVLQKYGLTGKIDAGLEMMYVKNVSIDMNYSNLVAEIVGLLTTNTPQPTDESGETFMVEEYEKIRHVEGLCEQRNLEFKPEYMKM